jgi:hypothetical protein
LGLAANTQPLLAMPTAFNLIQIFVNFVFGYQSFGFESSIVALWPLVIMGLFFIFTNEIRLKIKNYEYFLTVTFLPVIAVFVISYVKPIFLDRYLIFTTPTLFILIAWMITNYSKQMVTTTTTGVVLSMFVLLNSQYRSVNTAVKEDYRDVVDYLNQNVSPQDKVVLSAPFTVYPVEYLYNGKASIDTMPQWNRYAAGAIPTFSQSGIVVQIANYRKIYNRMFVVLSYDQGYQTQIQNYLDHNLELLTSKTYPANIQLRVYRLRYDTQVVTPPKPDPSVPDTPIFNSYLVNYYHVMKTSLIQYENKISF